MSASVWRPFVGYTAVPMNTSGEVLAGAVSSGVGWRTILAMPESRIFTAAARRFRIVDQKEVIWLLNLGE